MNTFLNYTLLLVEDDDDKNQIITTFLEYKVQKFYSTYSTSHALDMYIQNKPDIVLVDSACKNILPFLEEIRKSHQQTLIIMIVKETAKTVNLDFIKVGIDAFWIEPLSLKNFLSILHKVTRPMELEWKLSQNNKQKYDTLTGLPNYLKMEEELNSGMYKHIILLDTSTFSTINKQYGKQFSNEILKAIAIELRNHTTAKIALFKAESDRFVFLHREENAEKIEIFCQQIIGFFDTKMIKVQNTSLNISFSIGIAKIIEKESSIINAEYALEFGKGLGSRYYYFFDKDAKNIQKEKEIIKWLDVTKEMLENNLIEPYYQAIVDIESGKTVKYEVLARGYYNGELYSPYQFIGSAERMGLIGSLTRMIINKSFAYFEKSDICFSINLTQRDLLDQYLISFLKQKLQTYDINPHNVTFEILESVTSEAYLQILIEQIKSLKAMGFEIAMDDFGIENSTFSRILDIDFDYIKIDAAFIKNLENDSIKDRVIVSAIVGMAKALGIPTIAEFVKNEKILQIVKDLGVDLAQGEYFGHPQKLIK